MKKKELEDVNEFFDNAYITGKKNGRDILIGELMQLIQEIKYRNHNPKEDCDCETCRICNELLEKLVN